MPKAGGRNYSFVTDLPVTADTVAELAARGRARWKIENETFKVLKTNGYNLEHNFGHGKQTLASVLVALNLLAFAFHTVARLAVLAWREAVIARGATYRFFEHLRTVTAYVVFETWTIYSDRSPPPCDRLDPTFAQARIQPTMDREQLPGKTSNSMHLESRCWSTPPSAW